METGFTPIRKVTIRLSTLFRLTPQQALELITPQQAPATTGSISKFSYQNFEKVKIFNSRIWKIYVQGSHITKYLGI